MPTNAIGNATTARLLAALAFVSSPNGGTPTQSALIRLATSPTKPIRQQEDSTDPRLNPTLGIRASFDASAAFGICSGTGQISSPARQTTPCEHLIGEIRRWSVLTANWDGEGASAPNLDSANEAIAFSRLLAPNTEAEAMLHATGRAGLYWKNTSTHADLEFLGNGRVAYYIEHEKDKHKGVVSFDSRKMPAVFAALLPA